MVAANWRCCDVAGSIAIAWRASQIYRRPRENVRHAGLWAVIATNRVMSRLLADVRSMRRSGTITVYCRAGTVMPHGVAVGHRWIIASGVGAIVPGLPGVGLRAVARVGIVAVIARAGIVTVILMVGIVAVIPVVVERIEGVAITPPKRWVDASEPERGAEMPKATVEPAAVKPSTPPVKSPAATAAIIGIGHLWLNNSGSKQQCC